jgi:hypothetical protein
VILQKIHRGNGFFSPLIDDFSIETTKTFTIFGDFPWLMTQKGRVSPRDLPRVESKQPTPTPTWNHWSGWTLYRKSLLKKIDGTYGSKNPMKES